jgi:NAD(P) transhydrogenase subunit alpha
VLVDLAVERGGNVEGSEPGKVVTTANGVKIVGHLNVPGRVAASASLLYAKNLYAFVETMVDKSTKTFAINREDELVKATMLTDAGRVVHPAFAAAAAASQAAPAEAKPGAAGLNPADAPEPPPATEGAHAAAPLKAGPAAKGARKTPLPKKGEA